MGVAEQRGDVGRARKVTRAGAREVVRDPGAVEVVGVDRVQLGARERVVNDPVGLAVEVVVVQVPEVVDGAGSLGCRCHERPGQARPRFADLERVEHRARAGTAAELGGEVRQVELLACAGRVAAEARAELVVGQ